MQMKIAAAALALGLSAGAGHAQECGPTDVARHTLADRFGEQPVARGLDSRGVIMELWVSVETGTWTVLIIGPDGEACLAGYGTDMALIEPAIGQLH